MKMWMFRCQLWTSFRDQFQFSRGQNKLKRLEMPSWLRSVYLLLFTKAGNICQLWHWQHSGSERTLAAYKGTNKQTLLPFSTQGTKMNETPISSKNINLISWISVHIFTFCLGNFIVSDLKSMVHLFCAFLPRLSVRCSDSCVASLLWTEFPARPIGSHFSSPSASASGFQRIWPFSIE